MTQLVLERRRTPEWWQWLRRTDVTLITASLALAAFGVLVLYSATKVQLEAAGISGTYYASRQALFDLVGVVAMVVVAAIGYRRLVSLGGVAYVGLLLALLAVYSPLGHSALGAVRWIPVGPFQLQPSAFGSTVLTLSLAWLLERYGDDLPLRRVVLLVVMALVPLLLVVKEPDLGSAILMTVTVATTLVVGGVRGRHLALLVAITVAIGAAALEFHLLHGYQAGRIEAFLHPHSAPSRLTYNTTQSEIAISSGGIRGNGLFRGLSTNLGYVPEQTTDFVFSAVGEQLGFVGGAALLGLVALIAWRIWRQAVLAGDRAGRLVCAGALGLVVYSTFQNAGMTMGIIPVAGIPLPLVSYGGSAVVNVFVAIGLVVSVGLRRARP